MSISVEFRIQIDDFQPGTGVSEEEFVAILSDVFPYKKEESLQELCGAAVSELKTYTSKIIKLRDLGLQVSDVFAYKKEQSLQELCGAAIT